MQHPVPAESRTADSQSAPTGGLRFEFATAPRIIFGRETLDEAGPVAAATGRRALVVTGRTPDRARPLFEILHRHQVAAVVYPVDREPDVDTIRAGTALARTQSCDQVIGIGGGAALDTGKAIAAMLTNEGDLLDYLEIIGRGRLLKTRSAPFTAVPTTAGTGTEVTNNSVIISTEHRVKVSLRNPLMMARTVIVDPGLTHDLPPHVTAMSGMDALTQLLEPFVCTRATPLTDALCREGMTRAARSLRRAFLCGHDSSAREDMAIAGLFSGMALANAGLGAVHGIAGPLGGMFPAPHGAVCAALLPHVVRANLRALRERAPHDPALDRYREVASLLMATGDTGDTEDHIHDTETGSSDALATWLETLVRDLHILPLGTYGVEEGQLDELVQKAKRASSMKANPIALTMAELKDIVRAAL